MQIFFTERFKKNFVVLPIKTQKQFEKRIALFIENPRSSILRTHFLKGNLVGFRAFSVTGDYRVIYKLIGHDSVKLVDIGTHNQVY